MHRPAIREGPQAEAFRQNLSLVESPPLGTPVNHLHAHVGRTLQIQGAMRFPIPERVPKREWISEEAWRSMTLLHDWKDYPRPGTQLVAKVTDGHSLFKDGAAS